MTRHVALLRGVNVGGVPLKNAQLVAVFEASGFTTVRAVLASGNVVFDSASTDEGELRALLESALSRDLHYEAHLVVETQERLAEIARDYPFERDDTVQQPYVVFSTHAETITELRDESRELSLEHESLAEGAGVLYWRVPKGSSLDSPFAKVLARKRYASSVTTRNLRTVEKLTRA